MHPLAGHKQSEEHIRKRKESRLANNPNYMPKGYKVWNKGKTKESDERIKQYAEKSIKHIKIHGSGYVMIYVPNHPNARRGYVMEHRLIMEHEIGRYVTSKENVHHINGIKHDNRIENLQLMTIAEHTREHATGRYLSKESVAKIWESRRNKYGKSGGNSSEASYKAWETKRKKALL